MCRYHEFGTTVGDDQHVCITTVHNLSKSHSNRLYMHVDMTPNKCFEFQRTLWNYVCKNIIWKVYLALFLHSSDIAQLVALYSRAHFLLSSTVSAELIPWRGRPSCRRPSVKRVFSGTTLCELMSNVVKRQLFAIYSDDIFYFSKFLDFLYITLTFFTLSLPWDPMGVEMSKRYSSHSYSCSSTNPFLNIPCYTPHKSYLLAFFYF